MVYGGQEDIILGAWSLRTDKGTTVQHVPGSLWGPERFCRKISGEQLGERCGGPAPGELCFCAQGPCVSQWLLLIGHPTFQLARLSGPASISRF